MNIKAILLFISLFIFSLYIFIGDLFSEYKKEVALYERGLKTTGTILEYEKQIKRSRLYFLKYNRYLLTYEYYDQANVQQKYYKYTNEENIEQRLSDGSIELIYDPLNPEVAVEKNNLRVTSPGELNFYIIIKFIISIILSAFFFLLLNSKLKLIKFNDN